MLVWVFLFCVFPFLFPVFITKLELKRFSVWFPIPVAQWHVSIQWLCTSESQVTAYLCVTSNENFKSNSCNAKKQTEQCRICLQKLTFGFHTVILKLITIPRKMFFRFRNANVNFKKRSSSFFLHTSTGLVQKCWAFWSVLLFSGTVLVQGVLVCISEGAIQSLQRCHQLTE